MIRAFGRRFEGRSCQTLGSDTRLQAARGEMYTYPDLMALCGEPKYVPRGRQGIPHLLNPQVIIEVLSRRTEAFDRGDKFKGYRQIETVTDHLLVSADRMRVEQHTRQPSGVWTCEDYSDPEEIVTFASVGCEILLAEFYNKVDFETAP